MTLGVRAVVTLLLIGVVMRHFTAMSIGAKTYLQSYGWFYVIGGLWEALLCALLGAVIAAQRDAWVRIIGLFAVSVGALEGMQMAVCRTLVRDPMAIPYGVNACDHVTGLPITATLIVMEAGVLLWLVFKNLKSKRETPS